MSVGFNKKNFVTMHGHMNVKKHKLRSGVRCVVEGGRSLKLEVDEGGVYDA